MCVSCRDGRAESAKRRRAGQSGAREDPLAFFSCLLVYSGVVWCGARVGLFLFLRAWLCVAE